MLVAEMPMAVLRPFNQLTKSWLEMARSVSRRLAKKAASGERVAAKNDER